MIEKHFHIHLFLSFLKAIALSTLSIACFLFLLKIWIVSFDRVAGNSMVPTMRTNNLFMVNKLTYIARKPMRGDIAQIIEPTRKSFVIKRIIGLPGEKISFKEGNVYINDVKLNEPYLRENTPTFYNKKADFVSFTIPKNKYFVIGDNRMFSVDSRNYGFVDRLNITGRVSAQHDPSQQKITLLHP